MRDGKRGSKSSAGFCFFASSVGCVLEIGISKLDLFLDLSYSSTRGRWLGTDVSGFVPTVIRLTHRSVRENQSVNAGWLAGTVVHPSWDVHWISRF